MSQPEESREKTGKTDAELNRHQAPSRRPSGGGEAVDNTATRNEAREQVEPGRR
jgi:hypothetical protein